MMMMMFTCVICLRGCWCKKVWWAAWFLLVIKLISVGKCDAWQSMRVFAYIYSRWMMCMVTWWNSLSILILRVWISHGRCVLPMKISHLSSCSWWCLYDILSIIISSHLCPPTSHPSQILLLTYLIRHFPTFTWICVDMQWVGWVNDDANDWLSNAQENEWNSSMEGFLDVYLSFQKRSPFFRRINFLSR